MTEPRVVPPILRRLALVWAVLGGLAACGFTLNIDLGWGPWPVTLLGIVFAPGLLVGMPLARRLLLVLTWVGLAMAGTFLFIGVGAEGTRQVVFLVVATLLILLLLEQRWILNRPEVRRFFDPYGYVP